ncbi:MAG: 23S rRNA (adenine(2503)-C(2))-methyltransferase RlmN [Chloroflexi bacterium]|nr:23S rRNA (adenine(2503)-C(2))-methyltransferase RlmN [Chloroflexota bacterium]
MISVFDLTRAAFAARLSEWGEPPFRTEQIWNWLYVRLADSPAAMKNLPKPLREKLAAEFSFNSLTPIVDLRSNDGGTHKILFRLPDGRQIESVLMRYDKRRTACISTQAGCAMGCVFCATGQMGFDRHLTAGEIVEQVLWFERALAPHPSPKRRGAGGEGLTNVVLMGMGEPFHNYEATMEAIGRLSDPQGFNFGERRFTVSTVGLVPMIERFAAEHRQINLAVSLHAATDDLRTELLPVNKRYPLSVLMLACHKYVETTRRRLSFEWALIQNVNDTPKQAHALAKLIAPLRPLTHVNVIPLNPTQDYAGATSTRERAAAFKLSLEEAGIPCTIRVRRGIDIAAGCGQLRNRPALESPRLS